MVTETTLLVLLAILVVVCTIFSLKKWRRSIGDIPGKLVKNEKELVSFHHVFIITLLLCNLSN